MADQLATRDDLAALLQMPASDIPEVTATVLLESATAVVQGITGQRIVQVVDDEVVLDVDEYSSGNYLDLPQRPVTSVSSVTVGATEVTDWSAQLRRSRLWRSVGWRSAGQSCSPSQPSQPSTVTVVYSHGYPAGDQGLQLARSAVLSLAAAAFASPAGVTREQIDDYAVQYEAMSSRMDPSGFLAEALRRSYGRPQAGSVRLV